MRQGRLQLAVHRSIGLAKIRAAFGMPQDNVLAELGYHQRRDLASECPGFLPVHILGAQSDIRPFQKSGDRHNVGKRRANSFLDTLNGLQAGHELRYQVTGFRHSFIHLPISGNK